MKHIEDSFKGVDGVKLYYQAWRPDEPPKAVIQAMHGYAEHSGRYGNVVDELISRRYVIYASDLRGHGRSEGLQAYVENFEQYVEEQRIFFSLIKEKEPNLPLFILGHSMGAIIARIFATKYPEGIKGLVLSGAGTRIGGTSGFMKEMAKFLVLIIPKGRIATDLSSQISRDPKVIIEYREDPLVFKKTTVKLGVELLRGMKKANSLTSQIKIPTLVQSGSADKLVLGVKELDKLLTMPDKMVRIYEGLYHEVYNELLADRKIVLRDLGDWLDNHL
jgi:acylglycerol lipase